MAKFLNLLKLRGFTSPSDAAVEISAATDSASASRLRIDAGGKLTWGDGTSAGDTNLYRTVANTLKTDDYLVAEGGLTIESYQVTTVGASTGNALVFDGTKFVPGSVTGGAAGSTYVANIGNGASTTFVVTHGLNTRDVFVQARNAASPYEVIDVQWEATTTSTVTFNFSTPPASNSVRVAIYAATTGDNVALPIDALTDVVITSPEEFQVLEFDGVNWVNVHASSSVYVRNAESTTLTTGTVVYLFGATGDHATVKRASNASDATSSKTVGVVAADIPASENGPVITQGYVDGINLSVGYTAGDILWLGTNGQFTKTKPTAPDHLVFVGVVVRATNNGIIYVSTQNGYELDELHNVSLPSPQPGEFLKYNGSLWVADAIDLGTDTTGNYVASLVAGTGVTLSNNSGEGATPTIAIGQAVATNSDVTFNTLTTSASVSVGSNLVVTGDLTVNGTTTTLNTTELLVEDNIITLNSGVTSTPSLNAGIEIERGTSDNVQIRWNETTDKWQFTNDGTTYKDLGSGGITVSDTAPSTPATGDLWYESDTGSTYVYYDSYWIEIGGSTAYDQIIGTIQAKGDLLAGTASQAIARLAVGTNGTRLVADSTTATGLAWASDTQNTVIDAKGDLLVGLADNTVGKLTVGTNGQILVADSSQTTGVGWVSQNTRNLLYNGAMQVAQRGSGFTSIGTSANGTYHSLDRWCVNLSNGGDWATYQGTGNDSAGFNKSLVMYVNGTTPKTAAGYCFVSQKLEGQDLQLIRKGTASAQQLTLSFWVQVSGYSQMTGTYIVELQDTDNNRHCSRAYTISALGSWEFKTVTFPADIVGALNNDNGESLRINFWLYAGSDYRNGSLATSWASLSNGNRAVGQTDANAGGMANISFTGVQLNVGPVAAPFEFKSYERELRECQRYCAKWGGESEFGYDIAGIGIAASTTVAGVSVPLPTPMRARPNNILFSGTRLSDTASANNISAITINTFITTAKTAWLDCTTTGLTQYRPYGLQVGNGSLSNYLILSAEL